MSGIRLGLLAAGALAVAAPAWPAAPVAGPAADPIGLALTGPPETAPTLWGAPPMVSRPVFDPAASAATTPAAAAPAPDSPPGAFPGAAPPAVVPVEAPSGPRAADQVGAFEVTASPRAKTPPTIERCTTGPAWWRASKGAAVVWIVGVPDQLPMDVIWDDTCLRLRLNGARLLITPPVRGGIRAGQTLLRPAKIPLDQRLPPALWARLSRRLSDDALRARDEMATRGLTRPAATVASSDPPPPASAPEVIRDLNRADLRTGVVAAAPMLYAPTILVARRLATGLALPAALGDPVADRAFDLAGRANMFVTRLPTSESQIAGVASTFSPSEADQQACLDKVLTELDAGHTGLGLAPNIESWARGDYRDGLLRMNVLNTCPYGRISSSFWLGLVNQAATALEKARAAGGITVAVLEYDALLSKGGILDRLSQTGWTITPPEQLR